MSVFDLTDPEQAAALWPARRVMPLDRIIALSPDDLSVSDYAMFKGLNTHDQRRVAALATAFPQVIPYFTQAPVLLSLYNFSYVGGFRMADQDDFAQRLYEALKYGGGLKAVMRVCGVGWHLRKLRYSEHGVSQKLLNYLNRTPHLVVRDDGSPECGFGILIQLLERYNARLDFVQWAMRVGRFGSVLHEIHDYARRRAAPWPMKWTLEQAINATLAWERAQASGKIDDLDRTEVDLPASLPDEFEFCVWSEWHGHVQRYEIHGKALRSEYALARESQIMHHCVRSYWPVVLAGNCVIYHMDIDGVPWTVELWGVPAAPRIVQVRSYHNKHPDPDLLSYLESEDFMTCLMDAS